ncbi:hypothetical protein K1T71_006664 [Dendrolimus kikuchii]|uniref:Uncharacterized protein n=1 Tax=Dendrolimus kikuchii TaxID=765133 RepID=A0ACC1D1R6_9NEOP|nr:hypothetical protein K1T71_006664 [Dendrolimus kikuchii]
MFANKNYVCGSDVHVPAHLNFGKYMLDKLRLKKDEIALENNETQKKITYQEFTQYAVNLAVSLTKFGVQKGDIVAVGSEKCNEFVPTVLGIVFTGATYTPYDLKSGRAVLKHNLSITKPKYFISSNLFWATYSDILKSFDCIKTIFTLEDNLESLVSVTKLLEYNAVDVDKFEPAPVNGQTDTAVVLYSSGTTGMPKGVQLTHLNCILNSLPDDFSDESLQVAFLFGEYHFGYDTFITYKFLSLGRKIVYVNEVTPKHFLKAVEDCKVNIAFVVPSFVAYLSKTNVGNRNVDTLKIIYATSSPLHRKTMEIVKNKFPKLKEMLQAYGMTETGVLTSETWASKGPKSGSVGIASPGITLKVVDPETRKIQGPNGRGEICLRSPAFMKGYIGMDPSIYLDDEGFFKTGDLGYYDEDGYFFIVDRLKEIIVYEDYKVAPLELETVLQLHPAVREAAVVGKPVLYCGEEPTAFVVKQPGRDVTEQELLDHVANEVPPYMQLRGGIRFIEAIPRNPRGKMLRTQLRKSLNGCEITN